jgi:hypothetical protein
MIRVLVIIAVAGFLLSVVCIGGAVGLAGQAIAQGKVDPKWTNGQGWFPDSDGAGPVVELNGSGVQGTRQVAWNGDDSLTINVPSEVTYTEGSNAGVTLTGPSNLIERIEVDDGRISLRGVRSRNYRGNGNIKIAVVAPHVSRFEFNGAQKVQIRDYSQDDMRIQVNGASEVKGYGHAKSLDVELNGASKVDMEGLKLENAKVQMNGASDVTAGPTESADVEINGVGQATLLGQPKSLNREIHGLGSVTVRDSPTPAPVKETEKPKAKSATGDAGKKKT